MSLVVRPPSIPELAAEGWEIWDDTDPDHPVPLELHWIHAPSFRSICISEARERAIYVDDVGTEHTEGWFVVCREHDPLGNPIEGTIVGPFPNMASAVRQGRVLRRVIMSESRPDLSVASQCELFPGLDP